MGKFFQRLIKFMGSCNFWSLKKFTNCMRTSFDYVLIICMKKYKMAYHNYAEAKRVHQIQKIIYSNPVSDLVHSVKNNLMIKIIIYNDIFTSLRCKNFKVRLNSSRKLFSLVCYFFTLN